MHRSFAAAAIVALLAGCSGPAPPGADDAAPAVARVEQFAIEVAGQEAVGLLALPAGRPSTLVVLAHPWGSGTETFLADLQRLAHSGVAAVAMEFRGGRDGFKVQAGVEDTVAATLALQERYPSVDRTLLYGWSMGG